MAIYLGNSKLQLLIDGASMSLNVAPSSVVLNGIMLMSNDGYLLKDVNGLYLTVKEG